MSTDDIPGGALDTLIALVENGPLWDGDVPSKSARDWLVRAGYAAKVLVKGEDGFQAATYKGAAAYREHFGGATSLKEAKAFRQAGRILSNIKHGAGNG